MLLDGAPVDPKCRSQYLVPWDERLEGPAERDRVQRPAEPPAEVDVRDRGSAEAAENLPLLQARRGQDDARGVRTGRCHWSGVITASFTWPVRAARSSEARARGPCAR